MSTSGAVPHSQEAEWSVVGQCLSRPGVIAEVIGMQLEPEDFFSPDTRIIYETAVRSYYSDDTVDAVTVGEKLRDTLARQWSIPPEQVAGTLWQQASARAGVDAALDHAKVVRRHSDNRRLMAVMDQARMSIQQGDMAPEEVGDFISTETLKVVTGTKKRAEILTWLDVGREYAKWLQRLMLARERGVELAVYTGLKFVDSWTKGLAPTELMLVAGEPGVGKSALTWKMAEGFANRQLAKGEDKRIGTFVLSLEMGLVGSSGRLASSMTGVEGDKLREGVVTQDDLNLIVKEWKNRADLPIFWNFASNFRMSQLRAIIVEAIRRYNVGLVVIDHFRMFDPDRRINNPNQEDEAKARFLKEDIAKDLNVAVLCLAHTVKIKREGSDGRPLLGDLRGSGQVAAHCDIAAFMYRPWDYATENEKSEGVISPTDAELIFRKNRSSAIGTSEFMFRPSDMTIRDRF